MEQHSNELKYKHLGIYTQNENVVYMREDCHVCVSEGFESLTRIRISNLTTSIVASLNVLNSDILLLNEIGLSDAAAEKLNVSQNDTLYVSHLDPIESLSHVRAKIYNQKLDFNAYNEIITDIIKGNYSNIHLSAFIAACAGDRMDTDEISDLTKAMIASGKQLNWNKEIVVDKHCIGGLPGNRTTPLVVAIVAAYGLTMPKTSSRAITSPAGTADTMEVFTNVTLSSEEIKNVVEKEGGCIVWGGTAQLSPADDILIKIEKALDIDSEGQLIASVLSKKAAAGSTHVVIDIPVGETAKVRSTEMAQKLKAHMETVGDDVGLNVKVVITDGTQPVGRGIGPTLEAIDILKVLKNEPDAPKDLAKRAILLAGELFELSGKVEPGTGSQVAKQVLESGKAYKKFIAICEAQGRF
jgi:thymidine phosphorylase